MPEVLVTPVSRCLCASPYIEVGDFVGSGRLGTAWPLNEHNHEQIQITILTGKNSVRADWVTDSGSKCQKYIRGPAVCITPALQPHSMVWEEVSGSMMVMVSSALLGEDRKPLAHPLATAQEGYGMSDTFLVELGDLLIRTRDAGLPVTGLYAEAAALKFLEHVSRHGESLQAKRANACPRIGQVFEFIEENLESELSVVLLSRIACTSPFHFGDSSELAQA